MISSIVRQSDILVGALDENDVLASECFVPTRFYYYDELTWCVQEKQPIPIWHNFFLLLKDRYTWAAFMVTYISAVCMAYFIQQFETLQPKWDFYRLTISAICHFVGFVYPYKATCLSNRVFFVLSLFACKVFESSSIAISIGMLNKPRFKEQIKTVEEIINPQDPFELTGDYFSLQQLLKQNEVDTQYKLICGKSINFFSLYVLH